ncbi:MAG: ABC transporter permease [Chitinophagaceae bacterium]
MIKNYLKIALRQIWRHKGFAAINVLGLAVGLAACLLVFVVVRYELSYDRFLPGNDRIYAIPTQDDNAGDIDYTSGIPEPALEALRVKFPEYTIGSLISSYGSQVTVLGSNAEGQLGKKFIEPTGIFFLDPEWFSVFPYHFETGSAAVLNEPGRAVLTQEMAMKYFGGSENAIGQYLKLDNAMTVQVAGILKDVPANTDFPLGLVVSMETARNEPGIFNYFGVKGSTTSNYRLYMRLPEGVNAENVNSQLAQFSKDFYPVNRGNVRKNFLVPLRDLHFDTRLDTLGSHIISKSTLWTLSLIGIFILIMACINFINLSTSQAVNRSKEIGVRKVLGGRRADLFRQMMGETAILVFLSLLLAWGLAALCMPLLKHITQIVEPLQLLSAETLFLSALLWLLVTVLAGFYPALILSGFTPLLALRNKISSASIGGISLRRTLVVTQFAISQILIIGTLVAITQMNFVRKADLGFNKEAILVLSSNTDSSVYARQEALKQQWLAMPGVKAVSFCSDVPSSDNNWASNFAFDHRDDENFNVFLKFADEDYFKTFDIQFLAGNGYTASDTMNDVVINETLLHQLGLQDPQTAIGKDIRLGRGEWKKVVGVVRDFKTNSLREATKPILISSRRQFYFNASLLLSTRNLAAVQAKVTEEWDKFNPQHAVVASFMDDRINNFYQQETRLSRLYRVFAIIAIFISCLGLYGLVSFMTMQRRREIGIRKVLGASMSHILYLFSREFTILVLLAFLIAAPLAWYLMSNWLENFAYRAPLGVGIFAIAIGTSVLVALLTVGYKSLRAASVNPVKSIRES